MMWPLLALPLLGFSSLGEELARFTVRDFRPAGFKSMADTTVSLRPAGTDSASEIVVDYQGSGEAFVPLFTVERAQLRDGRWLLTSDASADEGTDARLAIRYRFDVTARLPSPGDMVSDELQRDGFTARSLNLLAIQFPWYTVPNRAVIGLEFRGPGTVTLSQIRLGRRPERKLGFSSTSLPCAGAFLLGVAIWMCAAFALASRTVLGHFVLAVNGALAKLFAAFGILLLVGECVLFLDDGLGPGFAGAVVCGLSALLLRLGHRALYVHRDPAPAPAQ